MSYNTIFINETFHLTYFVIEHPDLQRGSLYSGEGELVNRDFSRYILTKHSTPQPAVTCSKLTIETLEQGVNYVHR